MGEGNEDGIVGRYGLGERNARGDRLIEFCARNKSVITDTLFQHHTRRHYSWKAHGDICRAQIAVSYTHLCTPTGTTPDVLR